MAEGGLTAKYEREAQAYLQEVHQAKTSGRWDKTIRLKDPLAERYSQAADDARQQKAIAKADRLQNAQDLPESVDLDLGNTPDPPDSVDLPESQPVRSTGILGKALDTAKDLVTPRTTLGDLASPEFLNNFAMMTTGGAAVGGLAGPGGMVAGGLAGALSAPLAFEGFKREVEKFTKMGYTPDEAQRAAALSSTVLGVASGLTGNVPPTGVRPSGIPPTPQVINQAELDALVKIRERQNILGTSLETRAYPVDPLSGVPGFTQETGNLLVGSLTARRALTTAGYRDWETDRKSTRLNSSH